ncbi:putative ribonuclease H-like domain-containing protein [Tanacetum coccineum]
MDQDSSHMVAASKVHMLKPDWFITPLITKVAEGVETTIAPTTAEEKAQRSCCGRVWRNAVAKKTYRNLIKQQYENFTTSSLKVLDQTFDRLQKLISQLEIHGESISQEDVNQKFLRTFVSSNTTSSTNGTINTAHDATTSSIQATAINSTIIDNLTDAVICAFFASQPNSPQLDLEEMDLRWQMAMQTIRVRRFLKKTRRKFFVDGIETIGFDKSKVECYNCHKMGHFSRECRAPRNQENHNRETTKRVVPVKTTTSNALISCDDLGDYDWSDQAEEGPTNFALMAYSSTSSNSEIVDKCKTCLGYNAVPPPYTGNFMPPKPDLSFSGLKEFVNEPIVSKPTVKKPVVETSEAKTSVDKPKGNPQHDLQEKGVAPKEGKSQAEVQKHVMMQSPQDDGSKPSSDDKKKVDEDPRKDSESIDQERHDNVNNTNNVNAANTNEVNAVGGKTNIELTDDPNMPALEDYRIFDLLSDDQDNGAEADMNNLDTTIQVSLIPTTRIHKDHPVEQIIGDLNSAPQTRRMTKNLEKYGFACFYHKKNPKRNKKDEIGIVIKNKARLVAQGYTQEEWIDYDDVFALVAKIEEIRLFLAYASFKDFVVYQMDVKSAFLYGKIEEEVYVCQPLGFEDSDFPDRVYKVEKTLYGLHQAPRAWYETLSTYLLNNKFQRGKIDKALFIKRDKCDILLVQVYVDDIIFGSTKKELCNAFEKLMHKKFQMSSIGELTFFLGLQVKQKNDGIFIRQDKYVAEILKKFGFTEVKTASTPMETQKPLLKDEDGEEVDVHLYRSMIGSLIYLTSSRPDIMFAVCACARYQVNPKVSHLYAVKRIFRYLKGQPKLGLWYPKDSPFDLVAYTDIYYAGASLDRKSTTGGCQFLGCRLISWQCKKQTVVANSTTKAEYVDASSCCGQVLWIQNQLLDYGYNFMHTKIFIDNNNLLAFDAKAVNDEVQLQALVDRKKIIITESTMRRDLQLEDAEGVDCLPNATIFEQLVLIRYEQLSQRLTFYKAFFSSQWKFLIHTVLQCLSPKTTTWNEFSSTMASVIICLAISQKFNFSKFIFESMVKNLDNVGKFLMYPRFVQVFLDKQLEGMLNRNRIYVTPSHTKNIFGNIRMVGKGFPVRVTPLFPTMVVQNQQEMGEGSAMPTDPQHTPTFIQPSTCQPQKTQKPRKPKRKGTQVPWFAK